MRKSYNFNQVSFLSFRTCFGILGMLKRVQHDSFRENLAISFFPEQSEPKRVRLLDKRKRVEGLRGFTLSKAKGFTLVELLLYMGIFMILLVVFLQLFSSVLDVSQESQSTSAVSIDGKYMLARLTYDVQNATSVITPANAGDSRSSLEVISNGADEDFVLSNNNLVLNNISAGTFDNINSAETTVSNLSFTRLGTQNGKPTITISFTLTATAKRTSGLEVRNFTTTVGLR